MKRATLRWPSESQVFGFLLLEPGASSQWLASLQLVQISVVSEISGEVLYGDTYIATAEPHLPRDTGGRVLGFPGTRAASTGRTVQRGDARNRDKTHFDVSQALLQTVAGLVPPGMRLALGS